MAGSSVGDSGTPSVESLPEIPQQTVDRGPPPRLASPSSPALDHPIGILFVGTRYERRYATVLFRSILETLTYVPSCESLKNRGRVVNSKKFCR